MCYIAQYETLSSSYSSPILLSLKEIIMNNKRYTVNPDGTITQITPSNTEYTRRLDEKYTTSLKTELEYAEDMNYDTHKL